MQRSLPGGDVVAGVSNDLGAPRAATRNGRPIAWWLLVCCALVFAMVVLGGVTRLTGSGLSMVNWKPVSGVLPPIGQAAWEREFEHYRETPEYRYVNKGMSLAEFKGIFWFEYAHRVLGRLIGIVFLLPFLYFLLRRRIEASLAPKLAAMFVLGGLQGLLGWYMVKSGLVDDPHVSQYRLAAHLGLAVLIYVFMLWTAFDLLRGADTGAHRARSRVAAGALILTIAVFVTMMSGAFVAGLKAGFTYNTFPLMAGRWVPDGMWSMTPVYLNLFENPTTVQFTHRVIAIATFVGILALWLAANRTAMTRPQRLWLHAAGGAAMIQVALGISTLLLRVPVPLAALHQAGAMVLLTVLLVLAHKSRC
ncbi:MAG: heme A synthase [Gammaproteobacteria bacterium]|nr:heme A synthase [Gammaproteobacteria bacterium]NIP90100.1 heme A synthase [Gammaproteobacteria bacterium]NIR24892.1 heme A synthase [Gammaproteobacteria bacterium]NIS06560.1 heme A synthase [Gammaproteobacteria bacterium]NIU40378.1 heme A synthase [Gammaproteobacteria bacterium]